VCPLLKIGDYARDRSVNFQHLSLRARGGVLIASVTALDPSGNPEANASEQRGPVRSAAQPERRFATASGSRPRPGRIRRAEVSKLDAPLSVAELNTEPSRSLPYSVDSRWDTLPAIAVRVVQANNSAASRHRSRRDPGRSDGRQLDRELGHVGLSKALVRGGASWRPGRRPPPRRRLHARRKRSGAIDCDPPHD
jgi:hypothetical protein